MSTVYLLALGFKPHVTTLVTLERYEQSLHVTA